MVAVSLGLGSLMKVTLCTAPCGHSWSRPQGTDCTVSPLVLQPAKLAEAFKYFVQGMGYSKYRTSPQVLGWGPGCNLGVRGPQLGFSEYSAFIPGNIFRFRGGLSL